MSGCSQATVPALRSVRDGCRCSTRLRGARYAPHCTMEAYMAELVIDGVTKRFGATVAVANLSLRVGDGEFLVLLGPTGAGKTTTLRLVAGLERPDAGHLRLAGR